MRLLFVDCVVQSDNCFSPRIMLKSNPLPSLAWPYYHLLLHPLSLPPCSPHNHIRLFGSSNTFGFSHLCIPLSPSMAGSSLRCLHASLLHINGSLLEDHSAERHFQPLSQNEQPRCILFLFAINTTTIYFYSVTLLTFFQSSTTGQ